MGLADDLKALEADAADLQAQVDGFPAILAQAKADSFAAGVASVPVTVGTGFTQDQMDKAVADQKAADGVVQAQAVADAQAADALALAQAVAAQAASDQVASDAALAKAKADLIAAAGAKLKARVQSEEAIAESHIDEDLGAL